MAAMAPLGALAEEEASWIFAPARFTHSPVNGQRVAQYCPEQPAYRPVDDTYCESAYRHDETTIRVGNLVDHQHIVQTWGHGDSIRPYGEWERPFRAGATPYGPWGNPQGPWTLPFDSWQNPYALGRLQNSAQFNPQQGGGPPLQSPSRGQSTVAPPGGAAPPASPPPPSSP